MSKKNKLISAVLVVALIFSLIPLTAFAAAKPTINITAPDEVSINRYTAIMVSTTGGSKEGTKVYFEFSYDASAVESFQYYDYPTRTWLEFVNNKYGAEGTGLSLTDAEVRFNIKFKTVGSHDVKVAVKAMADDAVIMEKTISFNAKTHSSFAITAQDEFYLGEAAWITLDLDPTDNASAIVYLEMSYDANVFFKFQQFDPDTGNWIDVTNKMFGSPAAPFSLLRGEIPFKLSFNTLGSHEVKFSFKTPGDGAVVEEKTVLFKVTHVHDVVKTEATPATKTTDGNIEYWYCEQCDKFFSDEALTNEISEKDTVIPATGKPSTPNTGDSSMAPWILLAAAALSGLAATAVYDRKRKKD